MDNLVNDEKINLKDVKPDKNLRILTGDRARQEFKNTYW